jgi:hypothetical protein
MQSSDVAKVEKVSKGVIKITFPANTNGDILSEVPVAQLLTVLEGKSGLGSQSAFPLNAPVPI